jgi:hypothetical protein
MAPRLLRRAIAEHEKRIRLLDEALDAILTEARLVRSTLETFVDLRCRILTSQLQGRRRSPSHLELQHANRIF